MNSQQSIRVFAFGPAAEALGWSTDALQARPGQRISELFAMLENAHPALGDLRATVRFALNHALVEADAVVKPGDELAILPPVRRRPTARAVKAPQARLVRDAIDVAALVREVEDPGVSAIATHVDVVRYRTAGDGRPLKAAEYVAYEPMALTEMHRICAEAAEQHPYHKAVLVHRVGTLKTGAVVSAAVVSGVSSGDAFAVCRKLVEDLLVAVPIFRKDIWQDGVATWDYQV